MLTKTNVAMIDGLGSIASVAATLAAMKVLAVPAAGTSVLLVCGTTAGDRRGGLFEWRPASTATQDDALVVQITGNPTGRFHRVVENNEYDLMWWGITLNSSGAAAANTTAINAAIQAVAALGGGTINFPTGVIYIAGVLDNNVPDVMCRGAGRDQFHNGGSNVAATIIRATTANTMVMHRTPINPAASKNTGGGWTKMNLDANGVATRMIHCTSVNLYYHDLYLQDCVGSEAALYDCLIDTKDIADSATIQKGYSCLSIRQLNSGAAQNCHGVKLGNVNGVANVSLTEFDLDILHTHGHALWAFNCDNVDVYIRAYAVPGGTGKGIYCSGKTGKAITGITQANPAVVTATSHGFTTGQCLYIEGVGGMTSIGGFYLVTNLTSNTFSLQALDGTNINSTGFGAYTSGGIAYSNPQGGGLNHFSYAASVNAIFAEGTDTSGVIAGVWNYIHYDSSNGTPLPTAGTSSFWMSRDSIGNTRKNRFIIPVMGDGEVATSLAVASLLGTEGLRIWSGSSAHSILQSTSSTWGIRIDEPSGDLIVARLAGVGSIAMQSLFGGIKIGGYALSYGAADSGGTGKKTIVIDNAAL